MIWAERGYVNIWERNKQFSSLKRHVQKWHGNLAIVTVKFRGKYHGANNLFSPWWIWHEVHFGCNVANLMKYNSSTDVSLVVSNTFRTSMDALLPFYPGTKQQRFIRLQNCIFATVETFSVSIVNKLTKLYQIWQYFKKNESYSIKSFCLSRKTCQIW